MRGRQAMSTMIPSHREPPQRAGLEARGRIPRGGWHTRSSSSGELGSDA